MDDGWVHAYAMMLGISGDPEKAKAIHSTLEPGIYEVCWPGGVRYRDANRYNAVVEQRSTFQKTESVPRALPGQQFRIKHFVKGEMQLHDEHAGKDVVTEVSYGYIEWPRLFLP